MCFEGMANPANRTAKPLRGMAILHAYKYTCGQSPQEPTAVMRTGTLPTYLPCKEGSR